MAAAQLVRPLKFNQHGQSGMWMSEAFDHLGKHADDMCVINSMWTDVPNHPQSFLMLHTGEFRFPRPSMGSWLLYGLGTENQSLPGFITINPPTRVGGAQNYASGFLPPIYQGTSIGHIGADITKAGIGNVKNAHLPSNVQRKQVDLIQQLNQDHLKRRGTDASVEGVIQSLELGFRMQDAVPGVMDVSGESKATLDMYGIDEDGEPLETVKASRSLDDKFGLQCLLARRLSEAGVRFVEICHSNWDQHGSHRAGVKANGFATDRGIAALLTDLKTRGLLDETLVIWGGEFGRTPLSGGKDGSGHNSAGFTMWMAGGGVKGGMNYGKTDETGRTSVENKVHVHDLHATILHQMGLDHTRLTYQHTGRPFRLTNIYGNVIKDILT